ncbi:MAG: HlyD family efflux transporter periplasmic adaptor subunit [Bacteroidota bacterium]
MRKTIRRLLPRRLPTPYEQVERDLPMFVELVPIGVGVALGLLMLWLAACGAGPESDAFGNFDATEITVSAEARGRLLRFDVDAGDHLAEGQSVGVVDTTQLAAQRDALRAQRDNLLGQQRSLRVQGTATRAQTTEASAGARALAAQLATAETERARTQRLFADQAATARELNEREGAVRALQEQVRQSQARVRTISAQASVPDAQADAVNAQIASLDAQIRQIADQLDDARIVNPVAGTVLSVIAERGETVQIGTSLYTVADLDTLTLRAYATGNQLPQLRLGHTVDVLVDDGLGGLAARTGRVSFIAAQAQFTPTPIQTRDERAELVYAFDVRVPNPDGLLKVGMPGEVRFAAPQTDDTVANGAEANGAEASDA